MKKLVLGLMLAGLTSVAQASCIGPVCWDDQGLYLAGTIMDGNGAGMPVDTSANINLRVPRAKGQEIFCTDCQFNLSRGTVCVSTGTGVGAYVAISSATATTACR